MKRHFCNFFTAICAILYIFKVIPFVISAFYTGNATYIIQELIFIIPYCIGNFIIATLLIYSSCKNPVKIDESFKSLLVSFFGTNLYVILSWFINFKNPNANASVLYIATALQLCIQVFYLFALVNLGMSLTVLPEARTLKTTGIYGISRHPLYTAYMLMNILNVFINQTLIYIPVMLLCNFLQYSRAKSEEQILIEAFPEYTEYKNEVMFFGKTTWFKKNNKQTV